MMGKRGRVFLSPMTSRQSTWAVKGTVRERYVNCVPSTKKGVCRYDNPCTLYSSEGDCCTEEINQMMIFIGFHE
jgi:hypothetical protein